MTAHRTAGPYRGREVGLTVTVHCGRHGYNGYACLAQFGRIAGKAGSAGGKGGIVNFVGGIVPFVERLNPRHIDVKTNDVNVVRKRNYQGRPTYPKPTTATEDFFTNRSSKKPSDHPQYYWIPSIRNHRSNRV